MDWAHSEGAFHNHITAFLENMNIIFHHFQVSKRDYLTGSTRKILVVELLFHPVFISSFFCRVMKIGNSLLQWIIHVFSSFEYYFSCDSLFHATGQGSRHIEIESVVWQSF